MKTLKQNNYSKVQSDWKTRVGAGVITLMAILLPACANNQEQAATPEQTVTETETPAATEDAENVTTQEVTERTRALIGKPVTVRSKPIQKIGENTFTIADTEFLGGERILVVNATGKPFDLSIPQDAELQVTGTVDQFDVATVDQKYGLDLDEGLFQEYEGRPAIIAQSVALAPVPGEIAEQPSTYYNQAIAVPAEVSKIYGPDAFLLEDESLIGNEPLLALVPTQIKQQSDPFSQGERIVATGVLRQFVVADLERDYTFDWSPELRKQLEVDYTQRPVLIIQGIYPSALPESAK